MDQNLQRIYWVDSLGVMSSLKIASLAILNPRTKIHRIRYLSNTYLGLRILHILIAILGALKFKFEANINLYDIYDFSNRDSTWNIDKSIDDLQEQVSQRVISGLSQGFWTNKSTGGKYTKDKLQLFLQISASYDLYETISNLIILNHLAELNTEPESLSQILIVKSPSFKKIVIEETSSINHKIYTYINLGSHLNWIRAFGGVFKDLSTGFLRIPEILAVKYKLILNKNTTEPYSQTKKYKIAVDYTQGVNLDTRNDIFWFPSSGLKPDQVLIYSVRKRFPVTEKDATTIKDLGFEFVDLSKWKPGRNDFTYLREVIQTSIIMFKLSILSILSMSFSSYWLSLKITDLNRRINFWSAFLNAHGIVMHLHHIANSQNSIPLFFAAESAGAIDLGYQWSATEFVFSVRARVVANHTFFCWGPLFADQIKQNNLRPNVTLVTGNIFGYLANKNTTKNIKTRQNLLQNKQTYIVCIFDSSGENNIYQTPKMIDEFFQIVPSQFLDDPRVLVIIKPKGILSENLSSKTQLDIDQLISSGRCIIEDHKKSSLEIASLSDLTIGIGINTATLEGALSGIPGIHLDLPKMYKVFKGIDKGIGKYVFHDIDMFGSAIKNHIDNLTKQSVIGQHDHEFLETIDPFQDGAADKRIGNYIGTYMTSISKGNSSQKSWENANDIFEGKEGCEYILYP